MTRRDGSRRRRSDDSPYTQPPIAVRKAKRRAAMKLAKASRKANR